MWNRRKLEQKKASKFFQILEKKKNGVRASKEVREEEEDGRYKKYSLWR